MIIQIFGLKKDADTRKAERFFKERGQKVQLRDLDIAPPSRGELEKVLAGLTADALIDPESRAYKEAGYAYRDFDPIEELLDHPRLLKLPLVRRGKDASVGYSPGLWEAWLRE